MFDWQTIFGPGVKDQNIVITHGTQSALLEDMAARLAQRQGFSVATMNLDHVVRMRDPEFRAAYAQMTHVTADGNPIVWASRLAKQDTDLVTGSDLFMPVLKLCAQNKIRVGFFGTSVASLEKAQQRLSQIMPDLELVCLISPKMGFDPDGPDFAAHIDTMTSQGVQLCIVSLSAPRQEMFIARAQKAMPQTGFMGLGASIDFLSGHQKRAPRWVQKIAAEWVWRMLQNPKRLARRYAACALILPKVGVAALRQRAKVSRAKPLPGQPRP